MGERVVRRAETRAPCFLARLPEQLARDPGAAWPEPFSRETMLVAGRPGRRTILLADPPLIEQALVDAADAFDHVPERSQGHTVSPADGPLAAEGAHGRWQRRLVASAIGPSARPGLLHAMRRAAGHIASRWAALPDGRTIDLDREMEGAVFEIMVATVLADGAALDMQHFRTAAALALFPALHPPHAPAPALPGWLTSRSKHRSRARAFVRATMLDAVTARRRALAAGAPVRCDIVDLLLGAEDRLQPPEHGGGRLADPEIADDILALIASGIAAAAPAAAAALDALSRDEAMSRRLADEIASGGDDPDGLAYGDRIVREALRLLPRPPVLSRRARSSLALGCLDIEPGDRLIVSVGALHRHALFWNAPESFDPDRFAEALPARATSGRHRCAFLPFGAGPRACIAGRFATDAVLAVIAALHPTHRLMPAGTARAGHVLLRRRASSHAAGPKRQELDSPVSTGLPT